MHMDRRLVVVTELSAREAEISEVTSSLSRCSSASLLSFTISSKQAQRSSWFCACGVFSWTSGATTVCIRLRLASNDWFRGSWQSAIHSLETSTWIWDQQQWPAGSFCPSVWIKIELITLSTVVLSGASHHCLPLQRSDGERQSADCERQAADGRLW